MIPCAACAQPVPEGSRFCPSCAHPTPTLSRAATGTSAPDTPAPTITSPGSASSGGTLDNARFLPGTLVAGGRYRIIGLLGRGGMGEVYRADDLKLDQPVALKFLPRGLDQNEDRRQRFLNEVKLARQVSHPNVCRVYDLGEAQGQVFLSMEWVDGEDLRSLLRRVGRFPQEKAVQLARQLCAGLAAAHELRILHRDLKPANVLIDGLGRPKITDFGLAEIARSVEGVEVRAGTPAYQAPEQRRGESVSVQSDIFSLGLVLYELFTGEPAFPAKSIAELDRRQRESTPSLPSSSLEGFDPVIERVLLRCLEPDPAKRPASALAVAVALPGGNPLAAAVAAGETPSPELVAAAGERIEVPRWQPWTALAFFAVGLVPVMLLSGPSLLHNRIDLEMGPEVFEDHARAIAEELGHTEPPANRAIGLVNDPQYFRRIMEAPGIEAQKLLLAAKTSPTRWWYRESPESLAPDGLELFRPSMTDPRWDIAGMLGVVMDSSGNLVELHRRPADNEAFGDSSVRPSTVDWSIWFGRAGLDLAGFAPVAPRHAPPAYADEVLAWEGDGAAYPGARIRVRAAALRGRPVEFLVEPWWDLSAPAPQAPLPAVIAFLVLVVVAVFFARRNLRLGRGDRRGARRLLWAVWIWWVAVWALGSYHTPESTFLRFAFCVGGAMLLGGMAWVIYMASEPFVRRRWPDLLVSWARLLEGHWRDPLVGRDLVLGAAFAVAVAGLDQLASLAPSWIGRSQNFQSFQEPFGLEGLLGGRLALGQILQSLSVFLLVLFLLLVLVLVRVLTRRTWAAFGASALLLFLFFASVPQNQGAGIIFLLVFSLVLVTLLMRFGLLAAGAAMWLHLPLAHGALTPDLRAWYADFSIATLALLVATASYGFIISFGGRPLISEGAWEDA